MIDAVSLASPDAEHLAGPAESTPVRDSRERPPMYKVVSRCLMPPHRHHAARQAEAELRPDRQAEGLH
jgi:hypothetical protein